MPPTGRSSLDAPAAPARAASSGRSGSGAGAGGSADGSAKIKLAAATGALLVGVALIAWSMGAFDSLTRPAPVQLPPAQAAEEKQLREQAARSQKLLDEAVKEAETKGRAPVKVGG